MRLIWDRLRKSAGLSLDCLETDRQRRFGCVNEKYQPFILSHELDLRALPQNLLAS
jgi:hypothetical protein